MPPITAGCVLICMPIGRCHRLGNQRLLPVAVNSAASPEPAGLPWPPLGPSRPGRLQDLCVHKQPPTITRPSPVPSLAFRETQGAWQ